MLQILPDNHFADHAGYKGSTREHEIYHTDQEPIFLEIPRSLDYNRCSVRWVPWSMLVEEVQHIVSHCRGRYCLFVKALVSGTLCHDPNLDVETKGARNSTHRYKLATQACHQQCYCF